MTDYGVPPETARRLRFLVRLVLVWAAVLVARLVYLQIAHHDFYVHSALQQQQKLVKIQPPRGAILDSTGRRLAMSLPADSVYVNPLLIKDAPMAAAILAPILQLDAKELEERIEIAAAQQRGFLWVKRKIAAEESERLRKLKLGWIDIVVEGQRSYPYNSLAAHVVGSVDLDEQGLEGVELKLNDQLAGAPGFLRVSTDVQQRGFASEPAGMAAEAGKDIHLTIDSRLQYIAEQALAKAIADHHCRDGSVVAMDPQTGNILALANYPTFDPNQPLQRGQDKSVRFDLAASTPFEPGSVFKVVTVSAALETTNLRPDSIINCGNGVMNLFGRVIHDDVSDHYATLSMAGVLAHSSNIGAINIGLKVGKENLYRYIRKFGFGAKTGLPLPGESSGQVWPPERWQLTSIGSVAMGHEISVTVVQLAQACSIVANGGFLVRPRLIADSPRVPPQQVIRPETAIMMRQMMEGVNLWGTGKLYARIPGYTSGGKTGTAQMIDPETHKYTHLHNASYMGFAPVINPRIVVAVSAHGAYGMAGYGAQVAAPVFATVAAAALRLYGVPKDLPEMQPVASAKPSNDDTHDLSIAGLDSSVPPPPVSAEDSPGPNPGGASEDRRLFFLPASAPSPNQVSGPKVPDLRGKTMREVLETAESLGMEVDFAGSGLVRAQAPAPGDVLPNGEHLRVRFGN